MNKKELFKEFIRKYPSIANSVKEGKTTFQKLYELYDIYGPNTDVFSEYMKSSNTKTEDTTSSLKGILETIKGINMDEVKKNLEGLQSAVNFIEDFVVPDKNTTSKVTEAVINPKPLEGLFED